MRAVIQRVARAEVAISRRTVGTIERGLLVLLGIEGADGQEDAEWLSGKIARLRIFPDHAGLMNLAVGEVGGRALVVSQFTLFAATAKGNRPAFIRAARPEQAEPLYRFFVERLTAALGTKVETDEFGADMQVSLVNDGPVTILIDSRARE
jgi:D-tyrosyl-tRNA(Tyr) deacylase